MIPAFMLYFGMAWSSCTETPFVAYDLAQNMSKAQRVEWNKMYDDDGNVRFVITFHKMPIMAELGFERTMVNKHNCCQSKVRKQ
jgi:hypothetical protein